MASTNKTTNYELNQWLGNDYIKREDFNNDNELIDAALKANADTITSEAAARAAGDSALEDLVSVRPTMTTADITYYVNVSMGNDSYNGLTSGTAFKSIQKAINTLPKVINHAVIINIAPGTYDENVLVQGFLGGGSLDINGGLTVSTNYNVLSIFIRGCSVAVGVTGINFITTTNHAVWLQADAFVTITYCSTTGVTATYDGYRISASMADIVSSVASNKRYGIFIYNTSTVFTLSNSGIDNGIGMRCENGFAAKSGTQPSGTVSESGVSGGLIVDGRGIPVGVLPLIGGTMNGSIDIDTSSNPYIRTRNTSTNRMGGIYNHSDGSTRLLNQIRTGVNAGTGTYSSELHLTNPDTVSLVNALRLLSRGSIYDIYGTHNITTSTAIPSSALAAGAQHQVY